MMLTIETLSRQHQEVLAELARVERALSDRDHRRIAEFVAFLGHDVALHFALEEQALFRVLERHLSPAQGPLAVMNAEHAAFRELNDRLAHALRSGEVDRQRVCAGEIIELLRAHIAKEDHVLFPMAEQLLSPAEHQEVETLAASVGDRNAMGHAG